MLCTAPWVCHVLAASARKYRASISPLEDYLAEKYCMVWTAVDTVRILYMLPRMIIKLVQYSTPSSYIHT